MPTGKRFFSDDDQKEISTPTMSRSRNQLATAYAPGAFFTFEGGLGACIATPDYFGSADDANIDDQIKEQIVIRLKEIWQSWYSRAIQVGSPTRIIDPKQCIDEALLKGTSVQSLGIQQLAFLNPLRIGYAPAPLTFVCNSCGMFRKFDSTADMARQMGSFKPSNCPNPKKKGDCKWRQLDVIFVHWSGEWMPANPGMWEWYTQEGRSRLFNDNCSVCGGDQFLLHAQSPRIGEWYFQCANPSCGDRKRTWLQNDKYTTEIFREDAGKRVGERRMEPISYRASSAFYPQAEQFIVFAQKDERLLRLLHEDRKDELASFIAIQYGFGGSLPTFEEMKDILLRAGHDSEWQSFERFQVLKSRAEGSGDREATDVMHQEQQKLIDRWRTSDPPLLPVKGILPPKIDSLLSQRAEYSSKYDPLVLAVEHEALSSSKLNKAAEGGRSPFVRFNRLDKDLAPKSEAAKVKQEARTTELMQRLGLAELGLIREFELCKFTHGYTRVSPVPSMEKRNQMVPVRYRLFEPLGNGKRPIYVITQENEALYIKLDPTALFSWLAALGTTDLPDWEATGSVLLGGRLLEVAHPFGRYFSKLAPGDASSYRYLYTLLHTFAHVVMKNVSELSGLDLGSLGEYIFPADLAFVVYRNSTTMDLGNLSSLWRNENNRFLSRILEPATHRCNSGSLCDFSGGACPDCIMIPETSCIAQNRLLSRSVLSGGLAPREDQTHAGSRIRGFLEVVNASD